ncbi:MAG: phosphoadenosine phosphosulfate reductase family protein [Cyanobacteria bacterium J06623_7]
MLGAKQQMSLTNQSIKSRLDNLDLETINQILNGVDPSLSIVWAAEAFRDGLVAMTNFDRQSAVILHLVTQISPHLPIIWIDTGYLPEATYYFARELTQKLRLNLKVYQPKMNLQEIEAKYGAPLGQHDVESKELYDHLLRVEPLERALTELRATGCISGLRHQQIEHPELQQQLSTVNKQGDRFNILPILNWTSHNANSYLQTHNLPQHPIF